MLRNSIIAWALLAAGAGSSPLPGTAEGGGSLEVRQSGSPLYFFNFGDSYSATGFQRGGVQPSPGNPLGNPAPNNDVVGGGPNWVAFLTTLQNNTLVLDYDLASPGATINDSIVPSIYPGVESFQMQVQQAFLPYCSPSSIGWNGNNSIFTIALGINDIGFSYTKGSEFSQVLEPLMDSYFTLCDELYQAGARNFLFINVPPTNRSHLILSNPLFWRPKLLGADIVQYNNALAQRIPLFVESHPDVRFQTFDYFTFMNQVLDSPRQYGFKNNYCQGSGWSGCVWWQPNSYHPTSQFFGLLAHQLVSSLTPLGW